MSSVLSVCLECEEMGPHQTWSSCPKCGSHWIDIDWDERSMFNGWDENIKDEDEDDEEFF